MISLKTRLLQSKMQFAGKIKQHWGTYSQSKCIELCRRSVLSNLFPVSDSGANTWKAMVAMPNNL